EKVKAFYVPTRDVVQSRDVFTSPYSFHFLELLFCARILTDKWWVAKDRSLPHCFGQRFRPVQGESVSVDEVGGNRQRQTLRRTPHRIRQLLIRLTIPPAHRRLGHISRPP